MRQSYSTIDTDWERSRSTPRENRGSEANRQGLEDVSLEKHYSVNEISQLWGLSEKTVRRIFENEPGIVVLGNEESISKRSYVTRRIPESVLRRVHHRLRKTASSLL